MKKYLMPLWIFCVGQVFILVLYLFFPALTRGLNILYEDTETAGAVLWGWDWVVGSARLLIVVMAELLVCYGTAITFWNAREGQ
jgi:hypothetical protein